MFSWKFIATHYVRTLQNVKVASHTLPFISLNMFVFFTISKKLSFLCVFLNGIYLNGIMKFSLIYTAFLVLQFHLKHYSIPCYSTFAKFVEMLFSSFDNKPRSTFFKAHEIKLIPPKTIVIRHKQTTMENKCVYNNKHPSPC